jgi:hypothetical protein
MFPVCYYDYLVSLNWIAILTDGYFHRLKINHDSHEFILVNPAPARTLNFTFYCLSLDELIRMWR